MKREPNPFSHNQNDLPWRVLSHHNLEFYILIYLFLQAREKEYEDSIAHSGEVVVGTFIQKNFDSSNSGGSLLLVKRKVAMAPIGHFMHN